MKQQLEPYSVTVRTLSGDTRTVTVNALDAQAAGEYARRTTFDAIAVVDVLPVAV